MCSKCGEEEEGQGLRRTPVLLVDPDPNRSTSRTRGRRRVGLYAGAPNRIPGEAWISKYALFVLTASRGRLLIE
jgi:hypothetical protein